MVLVTRRARGAAGADFDNDGDVDLLVMNNDDEPALLRNEAAGNGWLGVELLGRPRNTGAVGARVTLEGPAGGQVRWVMAGRSYQSSGDPRLLFGLGGGEATALEVRWPGGARQRLISPPPGRYLRIVQPGPA